MNANRIRLTELTTTRYFAGPPAAYVTDAINFRAVVFAHPCCAVSILAGWATLNMASVEYDGIFR